MHFLVERIYSVMKKISLCIIDMGMAYFFITTLCDYFDYKPPYPIVTFALPLLLFISILVRKINERIVSEIKSSKKYKKNYWTFMILFTLFAIYFVFYSREMEYFKIFCAIIVSLCWLWWCSLLIKIVLSQDLVPLKTQS